MAKTKGFTSKTIVKNMTLAACMACAFKIDNYMRGDGILEKRMYFDDKDAADTFSEYMKELWANGRGEVYGAFCNSEISKHHPNNYWWEVSF